MKIVLLCSLVVCCLVSCKKGGGSGAVAVTDVEKFEAHVDGLVGLVDALGKECGEVTDEASFDAHFPQLEELVEKIGKHSAELDGMEGLSKEEKEQMRRMVEEKMKSMGKNKEPMQKLKDIAGRRDEVAALVEEMDSAIFANFMLYGRLTMDLGSYGGKLTTPAEAHIDVSDATLDRLDGSSRETLFRYLAGNPRWEIRQERGKTYAVRLEPAMDYKPTLNGFVSADGRQTRVLVGFGKSYGFGRERGNITRTKAGEKDVAVVVEDPHSGTPGYSSYTIVRGGGVFIEVYDQSPDVVRAFTQETYNAVSKEIADVLRHRDAIDKSGVMPVAEYYPVSLPRAASFEVNDGFQPGIFAIEASVSPTVKGHCYIKAFNVETGDRLSEQRMTPRSTRHVGWDVDGQTFFPYSCEVTVYEGNWTTKYKARFELWHRAEDGTEQKLAETVRMINGWQR